MRCIIHHIYNHPSLTDCRLFISDQLKSKTILEAIVDVVHSISKCILSNERFYYCVVFRLCC